MDPNVSIKPCVSGCPTSTNFIPMAIKFVLVEIVLVETVLVGDPLYQQISLSREYLVSPAQRASESTNHNSSFLAKQDIFPDWEPKNYAWEVSASVRPKPGFGIGKDQEGKDRRRQILYYVSLIRVCNKVLYQFVYSKASRYTASSCTDLTGAHFFSKKFEMNKFR